MSTSTAAPRRPLASTWQRLGQVAAISLCVLSLLAIVLLGLYGYTPSEAIVSATAKAGVLGVIASALYAIETYGLDD